MPGDEMDLTAHREAEAMLIQADQAMTPKPASAFRLALDTGYLKLRHKLYYLREKRLARRGARRRILFSAHPGWEKPIRKGFQDTGHQIHFDTFTPEAVQGYDLVVPLSIEDAFFMDRHRGRFSDNPLPAPSAQAIELCDDKARFHKALTQLGYGEYLPSLEVGKGYPYMLKKKVDEWGQSCRVIHNDRQEAEVQALLQDPAYFRQHMILGRDEYATHMLVKDGRLLRDLNIRYHFKTLSPIKGQDTVVWKLSCPSLHRRLFTDILKSLDYEGLCCINYKHDAKGRPLILEINPRFGGSLSHYFFGFVRDLFD